MKKSYLVFPSLAVIIMSLQAATSLFPIPLYSQGRISGIKFNDMNGNGRQDSGEPGLSGWTIRIADPATRYKHSAKTDATGAYSFDGLQVGTYTVSEESQKYWMQTLPPPPGVYTIQISNDTLVWDSVNFGDYTGRISGVKFYDLNANGRRDPGEPGLKGWHIKIAGPANHTKTTNDSGQYSFDGLPAGSYTVSEASQNYWMQTMPPSPGVYNIQISSVTPVWDSINFGNYTGRISGVKFNDLNGNGRRDSGEPGLQGFHIKITGPVNHNKVTNSAGEYSFEKIPAGNYQVYEVLKSGWAQTMPPPSGVYNIAISNATPVQDSINFGNYTGLRFQKKTEGMGFKIPTDAKLMTCNLACDTGSTYVCGYSDGWNTKLDYVTVKYEDGTESWVAHYNNAAANKDDKAYALTMNKNDGSVYVTGESYGSVASKVDIATVKYNAAGVQLWAARWNNPAFNGRDAGYAIALNPSGTTVFVTGETYGGTANKSDYLTIAYDASTGVQLWQAAYNGPGSKVDIAYAIAIAANGNPVITGQSDGGTSKADYATIMYDGATGVQLWVARYDAAGSKEDYAFAIKADGLGSVYVTGASEGAKTRYDYATIKYNAAGVSQWVRRYDGAGKRDYGYDLVLDSSGNVYVTGASEGLRTRFDYATVKYDPSGNQLWVNRYEWSANDIARSIDLNESAKKIFVTGSSDHGKGSFLDYLTQRIDATTGATDWVTKYNGSGQKNDIAYNVKVCPGSGSVVVTGTSYGGVISRNDLLTISIPFATSAAFPMVTSEIDAEEGSDEELDEQPVEDLGDVQPAEFALAQNYPNPFNPVTTISFSLPEPSVVALKVYNVLGQEVATLIDNEIMEDGIQQVEFKANGLASGVYFYRFDATTTSDPSKRFTDVKKMLLVK